MNIVLLRIFYSEFPNIAYLHLIQPKPDRLLGGVKGSFSAQSVDGSVTETNPFGLGLKLDYCLQKMTVDAFLKLAPQE